MVFEENKETPACDILYCHNWQKFGSKVFSEVQYDSGDMQHILILMLGCFFLTAHVQSQDSVGDQENDKLSERITTGCLSLGSDCKSKILSSRKKL